MAVVEMYETGMEWPDIAKALDTDVEEAMARYRDQAYEHWDTGWERDAEDGQARAKEINVVEVADQQKQATLDEVTA